MGVDSRILIKIINPDSWLNPTQLRQLSAQLTSVIGHENFMLHPEEDRHAISFVAEENRKWAEKYPKEYPNFDPNKIINKGSYCYMRTLIMCTIIRYFFTARAKACYRNQNFDCYLEIVVGNFSNKSDFVI